jgi:hypothetical protein
MIYRAGAVIILIGVMVSGIIIALDNAIPQTPPIFRETLNLPAGIRTSLFDFVPGFSGVAPSGIRYSINAWGYRDDPVDLTQRHVVFVGDSTAFGMNVAHEQTFPEIWEQAAGHDWQAVNISMPAFGTAGEYKELVSLFQRDFHPEWVVLCYHAKDSSNGLWDNTTWEISERFLRLIIDLVDSHSIRLLLVYMPSSETDIFQGSLSRDTVRQFANTEGIPLVDIVSVYQSYFAAHNLDTIPAAFYSRPNDVAHPGVENSRIIGEAIAEVIP